MTNQTRTQALMKLSDSDLTLTDTAEDIRGRTVVDRNGDEIGSVQDLMIDEDERKVRFVQIAGGGFLGIGEKHFMVPIDALTSVEDDRVRIDQTREHVAGGPAYDPDLTMPQDYWDTVYGYYGYSPYWTPGYAYPAYPYYPR